ncbi:CIC family chloride channel protein [Balneicella halophila]|uniref:CIC family chloride channel protein n=1 Tax=Balneicella halophila TaxID=1537566 RepID=A0A7L4UML7_BALHA|nr:chloride channel protein [Balneicella halophila]PVX49379.1 CIC family chloride channel protein [Balneicella halophila]
MLQKLSKLLEFFIEWRQKNLTERQFIYILSIVVGLTSGLGAVVLKNFTHFIQYRLREGIIQDYYIGFYFVFPLIGLFLVYLIMKYIIKHKVSHGIPSTLYAISQRKGIMKKFQMYGSILTAPVTIGFGGSVGLEGPTVATGAAIGSNLASAFRIKQNTRTLLIGCAAAGALSSIFKAPVAAIVFAIEVFSLDLTLMSLVPLLLASLSAIITSFMFFGSERIIPFHIEENFMVADLPYYVVLGIIAGFVSIYFAKVYDYTHRIFNRINTPVERFIIGGLALGVIVYFMPPLYGEGFNMINSLIKGNPEVALVAPIFNFNLENVWVVIALLSGLVFVKIIATSITFGAGGVGGIFAPVLFMGSIMGNTIAKIINNIPYLNLSVHESSFTLVGMGGLMAGVLHAPLTAIFLIAELTGGYNLFIPLMLTAAISYSLTKYYLNYSVYTAELGLQGKLVTHNKDKVVLMFMQLDKVIEKNFVTINYDAMLGDLVEVIAHSSRNIYPVVDDDNKFKGVIFLDDVREMMFDSKLYDKTTVASLTTMPGEIIYYDDSMPTVMDKFQRSDAWNLPVVDMGKYVGFVSKSKMLSVYRKLLVDITND